MRIRTSRDWYKYYLRTFNDNAIDSSIFTLVFFRRRVTSGVRITRHALAELSAQTKILHTQARDVHQALREMWENKERESNERENNRCELPTIEFPSTSKPPPTNCKYLFCILFIIYKISSLITVVFCFRKRSVQIFILTYVY